MIDVKREVYIAYKVGEHDSPSFIRGPFRLKIWEDDKGCWQYNLYHGLSTLGVGMLGDKKEVTLSFEAVEMVPIGGESNREEGSAPG